MSLCRYRYINTPRNPIDLLPWLSLKLSHLGRGITHCSKSINLLHNLFFCHCHMRWCLAQSFYFLKIKELKFIGCCCTFTWKLLIWSSLSWREGRVGGLLDTYTYRSYFIAVGLQPYIAPCIAILGSFRPTWRQSAVAVVMWSSWRGWRGKGRTWSSQRRTETDGERSRGHPLTTGWASFGG